jgi:hypothetical protein
VPLDTAGNYRAYTDLDVQRVHMKAAGFSEAAMTRWHVEFEKNAPEPRPTPSPPNRSGGVLFRFNFFSSLTGHYGLRTLEF